MAHVSMAVVNSWSDSGTNTQLVTGWSYSPVYDNRQLPLITSKP